MSHRYSFKGLKSQKTRILYDLAIAAGISITCLGIAITILSALTAATTNPYNHWLSGQFFF